MDDATQQVARVPSGALFGQLDGFEEGLGLVPALLMFTFGNRVGHNAGTGLQVGLFSFDQQGSDDDTGVEVSGKVGIEDRPSVETASRRLEFVDDLHGADFGAPESVPAGKQAASAA